jgi:hypothetical protein
VDGVTTNNALSAGDTYDLVDGSVLSVKNVIYKSKEGSTSRAEVSIGSGKITIDDGQEVELNDGDTVDGLTGFITTSGSGNLSLSKIVLVWDTDNEEYLVPGRELTMPGLGAIKLSMTAWNAPEGEETTVSNSDDAMKITTTLSDETPVSFDFLYGNGTVFMGTGTDANNKLVTNSTLSNVGNITLSTAIDQHYFVAMV